MKLLVLGYRQSGKDEFAEMVAKHTNLRYKNASLIASEKFIFDNISKKYKDPLECYDDRGNNREEWRKLFDEYHKYDEVRFYKEVLEEYDIYCGIRNPKHLAKIRDVFDLVVWIDAEKRVGKESDKSNNVYPYMADYVFDNNGSYEDFVKNTKKFCNKINRVFIENL